MPDCKPHGAHFVRHGLHEVASVDDGRLVQWQYLCNSPIE
jgi:hypothetical protein